MRGPQEQLSSAALLSDPSRRALYDHVRAAGGPLTRDEVAARAGMSRKLAAFHLERLVHAGLLQARYEQSGGRRRGPGRPAKLYQPAPAGIELSIPPRRYVMLAEILLDAMETAGPGGSARDDAWNVARQRGVEAGETLRAEPHLRQPEPECGLHAAASLLDDLGFEPVTDSDRQALRPRNCPFHQLAAYAPELVCGLNTAFLQGVLAGIGTDGLTAVSTDTSGGCCVEVRTGPA